MVSTKTATRTAPGGQAVDHTDARLRALTEYALEIITVQDASGAFTYVNEAVTRYLGYPVSELLGRNAAEFLHADDAEAMRERFRSVLASEITPQDLNRFEYRFRHRDGSWC
jgi:PAS domain S-box-containing protein